MKTTWPKSTARDVLPAIALVLGSAYLLFRFPPAYQSWDALVYAYRAQTGQLASSLYSHHALSNLLFYVATSALLALGLVREGVAAFQAVNALLGGLAAGLFFWVARSWGNDRPVSAALAVLLVTSYGFWRYAGLADLYIWIILITLLFWQSGAWAVVRPGGRRGVVAGLLAAVSILSWQPNVILAALFGIGIIWGARKRQQSAVRPLLLYGLIALAVLLTGYSWLAWLAGARSGSDTIAWYIGYFGRSNWGNQLSLSTWPLVRDSAQSAVIAPTFGAPLYRLAWVGAWLGVGGLALAVGWSGWRTRQARGVLFTATLVWVGTLATASWWFDPRSPKFWLLVWLGCLLLAVLGLAGWRHVRLLGQPIFPAYVVMLALGLFFFNFMVGIRPEHLIPNYQIEAARVWQQQTRPNDLLIVGYDFRGYLNYYADRDRVVCPESATEAVPSFSTEATAQWAQAAIQATLDTGASVYRAENACTSPREDLVSWCSAELLDVLESYRWSPVFEYFDGVQTHLVYRALEP